MRGEYNSGNYLKNGMNYGMFDGIEQDREEQVNVPKGAIPIAASR